MNGGDSRTGTLLPSDSASHKADVVGRPKEFAKVCAYEEDSDEDESIVGKMPPSSDSID